MSDNRIVEMSKIVGQIEDELRDIKSAKEQTEAVIGSNKALSDSLQALFDSASKVAKMSEDHAQQIIVDLTNKIEMLNIQASAIESLSQQGVSRITEQSASAQSKLEAELGNLMQQLMGTISTSTNQNLGAIGNELVEYRVLVHEAAKKFAESTSVAIEKQVGQIAEIGKLVACIQERQYTLDSKTEELRKLDIVRMLNELNENRRFESENATGTRKWRVVELSAFGVCIVLGIAILIKLLVI